MAQAQTILQAVTNWFADHGTDDFDDTGGLWFEEVPEQTAGNYLGMSLDQETVEYTLEREYLEKGRVTFLIFAPTVAETERLALLVRDVFDGPIRRPTLLQIASARVVDWRRVSYGVEIALHPSSTGARVGQATFAYEYIVQRTLPN